MRLAKRKNHHLSLASSSRPNSLHNDIPHPLDHTLENLLPLSSRNFPLVFVHIWRAPFVVDVLMRGADLDLRGVGGEI